MTILEDRSSVSARTQEYEALAVFKALRTVLTHSIADAFDLTGEETMWVAYHIDNVLEPIGTITPKMIPLPVKQELSTRAYSKKLSAREELTPTPVAADPTVKQGSLEDWATVFSDTVRQCYELRPLVQSSIDGQFAGMLLELGIGHPKNPRASKYLPTSVRYLLTNKS